MLNNLIIGTCTYIVQYVQHGCMVNINLHSLHPCLYSWSGRIQAKRSERWNQQTSPRKGPLGRPDQGSRGSRLQGVNQSSTYSRDVLQRNCFSQALHIYVQEKWINFIHREMYIFTSNSYYTCAEKNNDCKSYSWSIKLNYVLPYILKCLLFLLW